MSTDHIDPEKLREKYELLQSLCKQQIMLNETLKSEVSRLSSLYCKVSQERSLLLTELLNNHVSCSHAVDDESFSVKSGSRSPPLKINKGAFRRSPMLSKRPRFTYERPQPSRPIDHSSKSFAGNAVSVDQEPPQLFMDNSNRRPTKVDVSPKLPSGAGGPSRLQNMATHLNAAGNSVQPKFTGSISPPSITVGAPAINPLQQRGLPKSNVTLLSSTAGNLPFVSISSANRGLSNGPGTLKNHQPAPPHASPGTSTNIIRMPTERISCIQSSQSGTILRPSTSGPRILIQPSSTNVRSVLLKATDNLSGIQEERH